MTARVHAAQRAPFLLARAPSPFGSTSGAAARHWAGRSNKALSDLEGQVASSLADLPERWPVLYPVEERLNLALFVAVHLLRLPRVKEARTEAQRAVHLRERAPSVPVSNVGRGDVGRCAMLGARRCSSTRWSWSERARGHALDACELHRSRTGYGRSASRRPPLPVRTGRRWGNIAPLPAAGLLHALEFRFAIDPCHLLLLIWIDAEEPGRFLLGHPGWQRPRIAMSALGPTPSGFTIPGPTPCSPRRPSYIPRRNTSRSRRASRRSTWRSVL
jgi:hypothetical protein